MPTESEPRLLDLRGFQNSEEALALAAQGCPEGYTNVAKKHMQRAFSLLFASFVSRMRGLHEGVVREIAANNPHAALPLMRAWVETITIALYVLRRPGYAEYLLHGPGNNRPGKKSFEAMFHAVREDAAQLKLVYAQLSDYSHFGSLAVWNAHSIEGEEERTISWTDAPRWRDETHFQAACAQAHELAVAGLDVLDRLGKMLVTDVPISEGEDNEPTG
jgi:hypothetical protein